MDGVEFQRIPRGSIRMREVLVGLFCRSVITGAVLILLISGTVAGQIQFSKPKSDKPVANPLIVNTSRDEVRSLSKQILESREIPIDKEDCSSQNGQCTLITKPVVFIKGITTRSQLEHYCEVPGVRVQNWIKGRYTLRIQIDPASATTALVGVYAKFEGMTDGVLGNDWIALSSKGLLEDGVLRCIERRARGLECAEDVR